MRSGDMVYYRLNAIDAEYANHILRNVIGQPYGREVVEDEIFPAIVLKAYSTFDRVPLEEIDDVAWSKKVFSGVADIKVFLPMSFDLWLPKVEHDDNPLSAPQELQVHGSLLVYPAHGKFTTVEPPPLF